MIYRTVSKEETKKWERGKGEEDLLNLKEERKAVNLCIFWLVTMFNHTGLSVSPTSGCHWFPDEQSHQNMDRA
jgi:hypothetical protein